MAQRGAEFDQDDWIASGFNGGWTNSDSVETFDATNAVLENIAKAIQPNAIAPPATKAQFEAQLDEELFGEERTFKAGWNVGGDTGRRKAEEYARSKGLSPLDSSVVQYARKRGWL